MHTTLTTSYTVIISMRILTHTYIIRIHIYIGVYPEPVSLPVRPPPGPALAAGRTRHQGGHRAAVGLPE